jgi:hypothetical protein
VALSTTESEYLSMSMSLRDVIPIMELLEEMRERKHHVICTKPVVYCKVFEDNSGALELARLPKLRPRTKHINVCYHHFREHVRFGLIKILPVSTDDQALGSEYVLQTPLLLVWCINLRHSSLSQSHCEGVLDYECYDMQKSIAIYCLLFW